MVEIGIVGAKNSGKTALIEALIPLFVKRGIRVATIKHTGHDHVFDTPGTDSFRHRQAGAELTMALSQTEMALFARPEEKYLAITRKIMSTQFGLCLVEGDKRSERPKVMLTRNLDSIKRPEPSNIVISYGPVTYSDSIPHIALNDVAGLMDWMCKTLIGESREAALHD